MNHTSVLVIVDNAINGYDAMEKCERALGPFDKGLERLPYPVRPVVYADVRAVRNGENLDDEDIELILTIEDDEIEYDFEDYFSEPIEYINGRYMEMTSRNPNGQWSSYRVGGKWKGWLPMKDAPYGANAVQKRDLDLAGHFVRAEAEANAQYDKFEEVLAGIDPSLYPGPSLPMLVRMHKVEPEDDEELRAHKMDSVYDEYNDDHWRKAVSRGINNFLGDPVEIFFYGKGGRQAFVKNFCMNSIVTHSILDSDGEWWSKYDLGNGNTVEEEWYEMFLRVIENSPEDTWFAVYDITL